VHNFVADLLRSGASIKEAKRFAELKTRAIHKILTQIKDSKTATTDGSGT
jgi:hypothetical protein